MRSSSLCCAPPLPLVPLSLPPLPALPPSSMVWAAPIPLSSLSAAVWVLNQAALMEAFHAIFVKGRPVAPTGLVGEGIPVGRLRRWASPPPGTRAWAGAAAPRVGGGAEGGKYKHLGGAPASRSVCWWLLN